MVHHTISTSTIRGAERFKQNQTHEKRTPVAGRARDRSNAGRLLVRHACRPADAPRAPRRRASAPRELGAAHRLARASQEPLGAGALVRAAGLRRRSRCTKAGSRWSTNCARPNAAFAPLCREVRQLAIAETDAQRELDDAAAAALPRRIARRARATASSPATTSRCSRPRAGPPRTYTVPLYQAPAGLAQRRPWYTRQEIERCPRRRPRCAGARSPGWPIRSMR